MSIQVNDISLWLIISAGIVFSACSRSESPEWSSPEAIASGWPDIKHAAEDGRYDEAAQSVVRVLHGDYPDRQYAMWKWWQNVFGERADYHNMSQRFGDALFRLYDAASPRDRRIIAEVFGKRDFDVSETGASLRAMIKSSDQKQTTK